MLIIAKCYYRNEKDWIIYFYNEQKQLHRNDGPAAITSDGNKFWFKNDKYHREDGPAIEYSDGHIYYCLYGVYFSLERFEDFRIMKTLQDSIKEELSTP